MIQPRAWFQRLSAVCTVHVSEARPYLYQIVQCQIDRSHREREGQIGMVAPRLATGVPVLLLFCRGPCRACMHVHAMSDAHYSIRAQHQHACIIYAVQCSTRGLGTAGCWHGNGMHLRLRDVSVRRSHSVDLGLRIVGSIGRPEHVLVYRCMFTTVHARAHPGPGYYYSSIRHAGIYVLPNQPSVRTYCTQDTPSCSNFIFLVSSIPL